MLKAKVILYIATSIDGFIARKNGDVDWLSPYENENYGYEDFYKTISAVIMGHKTYQQILSFGQFPYPGVKSFVFTRNKAINKDKNVTFIHEKPQDFLQTLKVEQGKNIWLVGGSSIIAEFLQKDLIDEFILTIVPVLLGEGIPLFQRKNSERHFKLIDCKNFKSGLIQLHYQKTYE